MPVIAYKNRLLGYNISFAFNTTYTKDFKLKNKSSAEYLTTNYNVELLALSKYFLDKIPNIFSISYETKYEKCIFYASEIEEITKND